MGGSPFCLRSLSFSLSFLSSDRARRSLDRERVRWYLVRCEREPDRDPERDRRERDDDDDDSLCGDLDFDRRCLLSLSSTR